MINHAFRMKLKPGTVDEYRRRHDTLWPELADALRGAGIYDYSIFLDEETLHLFAVLKLRPDDSSASLPAQPVMQRWWDSMADLMETEPGNRPREWPLTPMFHFE
ncbi:L-rhamnose mutarotase [Massilia glaciei]|uniref:L-rhamnose mutarotase n=1 Tax=Massilia glaciei TaxID=1524097 RepID=A0A2U2HK08_9BURK|nr:L-rhamnose mutarotase [Massilia glaciei]PWF47819.1 L-rhamnose mutarotase [Massilia glaciei]